MVHSFTWLKVCTTRASKVLKSDTSSHQNGRALEHVNFNIPATVHSIHKKEREIHVKASIYAK